MEKTALNKAKEKRKMICEECDNNFEIDELINIPTNKLENKGVCKKCFFELVNTYGDQWCDNIKQKHLKEVYDDGVRQGFIKISFEEFKIKYFEMDKEVKEMNRKEKERLDGLKQGIVEAQKIIFG